MTAMLVGAYIGVGGIVIGVLLAGPVTYYFSRRLIQETHRNNLETIKISDFNKAAAALRAEFAEVLFYLGQHVRESDDEQKTGSLKPIFEIINTKELIKYEIAVVLFEPFLDNLQIAGFKKAWADCKTYMKTTEKQYAEANDPKRTDWARQLAISEFSKEYLDRITLLLEYAKRK